VVTAPTLPWHRGLAGPRRACQAREQPQSALVRQRTCVRSRSGMSFRRHPSPESIGRFNMRKWFTALVVAVLLGTAAAQDTTIDLGYVLWDSEIASTHVVAAVLMDELG